MYLKNGNCWSCCGTHAYTISYDNSKVPMAADRGLRSSNSFRLPGTHAFEVRSKSFLPRFPIHPTPMRWTMFSCWTPASSYCSRNLHVYLCSSSMVDGPACLPCHASIGFVRDMTTRYICSIDPCRPEDIRTRHSVIKHRRVPHFIFRWMPRCCQTSGYAQNIGSETRRRTAPWIVASWK